MTTPRPRPLDYFLVYSLLATWGMEYFFRSRLPLSIGLLAIVAIIAHKKGIAMKKDILPVLIPLAGLSVIHSFIYATWECVELLVAFPLLYYTVKITGERIWTCLYNILFFFSITSIIFYTLQYNGMTTWIEQTIAPLFKVNIAEFYDERQIKMYNILVHRFMDASHLGVAPRNSGPFWEPGLFAVFLNFALFARLFLIPGGKLLTWKNTLVIAATITTFSTMAYIALAIILLGYLLLLAPRRPANILVITLLAIASIHAWNTIPFLGPKIERERQQTAAAAAATKYHEGGLHRFAAPALHLEMINESPLYMLVGFQTSRLDERVGGALVCGLTQVLLLFGYPVAIIYYILLAITLWKLTAGKEYPHAPLFLLLLLLALVAGFSQDVPTRGFYYLLMFMALCPPATSNKPTT